MRKLFFLSVFVFFSACEHVSDENIQRDFDFESKKPDSSKCLQQLLLSFDSQDNIIEFGQGWQSMQPNNFKIDWLEDTTIRIRSFYQINAAQMLQCNAFGWQNYDVFIVNSHEVLVELYQPSLWEIYGKNYYLFKINLKLNYCNRRLIKF